MKRRIPEGALSAAKTPTRAPAPAALVPLGNYIMLCRHPDTGQTARYATKTFSARAADSAARDGFFGLLGVNEDERARLEVEVIDTDS